jgi:transcriptional regulator with XRE-family HTH domain
MHTIHISASFGQLGVFILLALFSKTVYNMSMDTRSAREGNLMSLGSYLRSLREAHRLTLRAVEDRTGVSNAYLSQLEMDKIRKPSPACLYKLSQCYGVSYEELMQKAGHPVPGLSGQDNFQVGAKQTSIKRRSGGASVLSSFDDLTPDEEEALLEYLAFLRSRRGK